MNIGFVQLGSFGDCINSTLMFKPIKDAYPDCNLEVHVADLYADAFYNNPYVTRIVTYPAGSKTACFNLYNTVPAQVKTQKYDKVFVPAPILHQDRTSHEHPEFGHNIICTFMRVLEDNGIKYDWPVETILQLTKEEVQGVDKWLVNNHIIMNGRRNILMEVHGESGQTFWNHHWTLAVGRQLMRNGVNLFISRGGKTQEILQLEREFRIHSGDRGGVLCSADLSIRQCAELYNRCDTFFSVSSGLSNACNTNWCNKTNQWIEVVNSPSVTSAPVRADNKTFWYENDMGKFLTELIRQGL